jgi:hypothetical protein
MKMINLSSPWNVTLVFYLNIKSVNKKHPPLPHRTTPFSRRQFLQVCRIASNRAPSSNWQLRQEREVVALPAWFFEHFFAVVALQLVGLQPATRQVT